MGGVVMSWFSQSWRSPAFSRVGGWMTTSWKLFSSARCRRQSPSRCSILRASWGSASTWATPEIADENGTTKRHNTSILVDKTGTIVGKYRKVHLPGHADHKPEWPYQHLEKKYFDVGDLGFPTWRTLGGVMGMAICNDRRWPETYRVLALKGAEVVMLGYNTPSYIPWEPTYNDLTSFHNHLCMQAGAYQNGTWVVGVAKAGIEEGCDLIGGSIIAAPTGEIIAQALTKDDELISARCDLDVCLRAQDAMFNFAAHRRIEHYGVITGQAGVTPPA